MYVELILNLRTHGNSSYLCFELVEGASTLTVVKIA